jgi:hypothetical protein
MYRLKYLVLVAVVAAGLLIYWLNPAVIPFGNYSVAQFTQQLTPLVLVSLFIERSLEVFITVWRGGPAAALQRNVETAMALPVADTTRVTQIQTANDALAQYKFRTQQIALHLGLVFGILIASIGVRGLGNFADLSKVTRNAQKSLFNMADVLLTGGVMGGGSDFMHKLITTFTDLMDATSQRAKGTT